MSDWNEAERARDEGGRFAATASSKAKDASKATGGTPAGHATAAKAHETAAKAHRDAAAKTADPARRQQHETAAVRHEKDAAWHKDHGTYLAKLGTPPAAPLKTFAEKRAPKATPTAPKPDRAKPPANPPTSGLASFAQAKAPPAAPARQVNVEPPKPPKRGAPPAAPSPAPAPHGDLKSQAAALLKRVAAAPDAMRFGNKVFLAHVSDVPDDTLHAMHNAGHIRLARADLVEAMHPKTVAASERHLGRSRMEVHLVEDPSHKYDWEK